MQGPPFLAAPSTGALHRAVRRRGRCLENTLRSIADDARFVAAVARRRPGWALFANLRAGAWYAPRSEGVITSTCYFKSTDGHVETLGFSHTRLNLSVAASAAAAASASRAPSSSSPAGAIIFDVTKAGKRFPDSLSKTVPVWAAVLNAVVLGRPFLTLPPWVPPFEASRIAAAIPGFVEALPPGVVDCIHRVLDGVLVAPLACEWLCQPPGFLDSLEEEEKVEEEGEAGTAVSHEQQQQPSRTPLLLVSASRLVPPVGDTRSCHGGWVYIPGAGDDAEFWAPPGLSPAMLQRPGFLEILVDALASGDEGYVAAEDEEEEEGAEEEGDTDGGACWAAAGAGAYLHANEEQRQRERTIFARVLARWEAAHSSEGSEQAAGASGEGGGSWTTAAPVGDGSYGVRVSTTVLDPLHLPTATSPPLLVVLLHHLGGSDDVPPPPTTGVHVCRLALPADKPEAARHKLAWATALRRLQGAVTDALAASSDAAILVGFGDAPARNKLCWGHASATAAAACAAVATARGEGVTKASLRSLVALAQVAAGEGAVAREWMQQLNRHWCSSGSGGADE